jgi:hypothetical protein
MGDKKRVDQIFVNPGIILNYKDQLFRLRLGRSELGQVLGATHLEQTEHWSMTERLLGSETSKANRT